MSSSAPPPPQPSAAGFTQVLSPLLLPRPSRCLALRIPTTPHTGDVMSHIRTGKRSRDSELGTNRQLQPRRGERRCADQQGQPPSQGCRRREAAWMGTEPLVPSLSSSQHRLPRPLLIVDYLFISTLSGRQRPRGRLGFLSVTLLCGLMAAGVWPQGREWASGCGMQGGALRVGAGHRLTPQTCPSHSGHPSADPRDEPASPVQWGDLLSLGRDKERMAGSHRGACPSVHQLSPAAPSSPVPDHPGLSPCLSALPSCRTLYPSPQG